MMQDPKVNRMQRLQTLRARPEPDLSMGFLRGVFKREVEKPFKQLEGMAEVWAELIPAELAAHTRLESFTRGVLHVTIDSSGRHFELDRLLREGLLGTLRSRCSGGALRQVKVRVGPVAPIDH